MSRPASSSIVSQIRFAAAGRVGSIELFGGFVLVSEGGGADLPQSYPAEDNGWEDKDRRNPNEGRQVAEADPYAGAEVGEERKAPEGNCEKYPYGEGGESPWLAMLETEPSGRENQAPS